MALSKNNLSDKTESKNDAILKLRQERQKAKYAIEMLGIHKEFLGGRIIAIDHIDFRVKVGTIHALIGENGSGKSTLMNTIFGIYSLDQGEMKLFDETTHVKSSKHASDLGIGMVHQHFKLVDRFTVLENVIMGQEVTSFGGILDKNEAKKRYDKITKKYNLIVDPDAIVGDLPVDLKQKVEIIKVLWNPKDILIFDEPTASLGNAEIKALLETMKQLREAGITIIFTSHKLEEIKEVADEATVLTNGRSVLQKQITKTTSVDDIIKAMIGEKVTLDFADIKKKQKIDDKQVVLKTENLKYINGDGIVKLNGLDIEVKKGEIFGIAGIADNGQLELVNTIGGLLNEEYSILHDRIQAEQRRETGNKTLGDLVKESRDKAFAKINGRKLTKEAKSTFSNIPADQDKLKKLVDLDNSLQLNTHSFNDGRVFVNGRDITTTSISERNKSLSLVPGDRHKWGVANELSLTINAVFKDIKEERFSKIFIPKLFKNTPETIVDAIDTIEAKYTAQIRSINDEINELKSSGLPATETAGKLKEKIVQSAKLQHELSSKIKEMKKNEVERIASEVNKLTEQINKLTLEDKDKIQSRISEINDEISKIYKQSAYTKEYTELIDDINQRISELKESDFPKKNKMINELIVELNNTKRSAYLVKKETIRKLKDEKKEIKRWGVNPKIKELKDERFALKALGGGTSITIDVEKQKQWTNELLRKYDVRGWSSNDDEFLVLSGGNQQKFVVGRELKRPHDIMLAAYPTRGLDIKAIYNLYVHIINDVVENQRTTLLFSHEIDELVAVCDRIAVIDKGRIVEVIDNNKSKSQITAKIAGHIMGGEA